MKFMSCSSRARWAASSVVAVAVLAGCIQKIPKPPGQSTFAMTERRNEELLRKAKIVEGEAAEVSQKDAIITITGGDILLPEATPDVVPADRAYFFDVVVKDPKGRSMRELLEQKILRIQTDGVEATLESPKPTDPVDKYAINTDKARLKIAPKGVDSLRPFTIRVWYPGLVDGPNGDRYAAELPVKVYYGDIRTRVQIIGRTEAEGMFGTNFAKHFFVGKVYLRNRSTTKSLAVYTTSMRVPVLFYRKSELSDGLTAEAADRLEQTAWHRWTPHMRGDEIFSKANEAVVTFLERESKGAAGFKLEPTPPPGPHGKTRARGAARTFPAALSADEHNALVSRVLTVWARRSAENDDKVASEKQLTPGEQRELIKAAMVGEIPEERTHGALEAVVVKAIPLQARVAVVDAQACALVDRVWSLRTDRKKAAEDRKDQAAITVQTVLKELPVLSEAGTEPNAQQQKRYAAIREQLEDYRDMERNLSPLRFPTLGMLIDGVTDKADRESFSRAAETLPQQLTIYHEAEDLIVHFNELSKAQDKEPEPKSRVVAEEMADIQERALWHGGGRKNASRLAKVSLGGDKTLAVSPDPHLQRQLTEGGHLWREAYRPMTFQAVLSSVMFTHSRDPKTLTVRVLETIATLAGGAIGLSSSPSSSTLKTTNFFSSVFVATLRSSIMEDLNQHITNLGEMAMDTVVIIPPNDSVDRFVFFPRGAIYNFPDEYDSVTPAYIRGIEGDELFVEAVPIASNQVVRGGAVGAEALVARALNEGERTESARLIGVAETQAKLRTVELANLVARINAVMEAAKQAGDEAANTLPADTTESVKTATRQPYLQRAQDEVRKMTAAFTAYFGPDQSGALAAAATKHAVTLQDAPPVALPGATLKLPAGTTSVAWPLSVTDSDTPMKSLTIDVKGGKEGAPWVEFAPKLDDALRARATFKVKAEALKEPERRELALTVADGGGSVVGFTQPIEVRPLAFKNPVFTKRDGAPEELSESDGAYTLPIGKSSATVAITLPLYDADVSLLSLAHADDASTLIASSKASADAASGALTLTLQIDASGAPANTPSPATFTVYLVPAKTEAKAATLTAAALAQITLKLDLNAK